MTRLVVDDVQVAVFDNYPKKVEFIATFKFDGVPFKESIVLSDVHFNPDEAFFLMSDLAARLVLLAIKRVILEYVVTKYDEISMKCDLRERFLEIVAPSTPKLDSKWLHAGDTLVVASAGTHQLAGYADMSIHLEQSGGVSAQARKLPGMDYRTECPAGPNCRLNAPGSLSLKLYDLVQHVNDHHKWSRDQIADWLDKLHDDGRVDLSFNTPDTQE